MSERPTVLVVDDVDAVRATLRTLIERAGMQVLEAADGKTALNVVRREAPDVMVLDVRMPGMDGHEVVERAKRLNEGLPIIVITAFGAVEDAVRMLKAGAFDYFLKPFSNERVLGSIHSALSRNGRDGIRRQIVWDSGLDGRLPLQEQMGSSAVVRALEAEVTLVAPTDFSVVITGETGVGKVVVARAIHAQSHRSSRRFVAVDCGAIPEPLIESEFFGYEKGAFTGADHTKPGKFEAAAGGTLFLDEISNLPLAMQSKLLRALQEKRFYHVGSCAPIQADVRIVAASNQDLSAVGPTAFRRDLYHRLSEYVIHVPPLRERKEDILFIAERFLRQTNAKLEKAVAGISEAALRVLMQYHWPGNVRELRNIIRRAVLRAEETVDIQDLGPLNPPGPPTPPPARCYELTDVELPSLKEISEQSRSVAERAILVEVLAQAGGNKALAARILRIDYKTIHAKIKKYGLLQKGGKHDGQEN